MRPVQSTYPLRLPASVKAEVERRARQDGVSINQFVATAVAEKLSALETADFFTARAEAAQKADFFAFLDGAGDEPPIDGDRLA